MRRDRSRYTGGRRPGRRRASRRRSPAGRPRTPARGRQARRARPWAVRWDPPVQGCPIPAADVGKRNRANRLAVRPGLACSADQLTIVFDVVFVLLAAPYVFEVSVLNFGPYMFDWSE